MKQLPRDNHCDKLISFFQYADRLTHLAAPSARQSAVGRLTNPPALQAPERSKHKKNKNWVDTTGFISLFTQIIEFFEPASCGSDNRVTSAFYLPPICHIRMDCCCCCSEKPSWIKKDLGKYMMMRCRRRRHRAAKEFSVSGPNHSNSKTGTLCWAQLDPSLFWVKQFQHQSDRWNTQILLGFFFQLLGFFFLTLRSIYVIVYEL